MEKEATTKERVDTQDIMQEKAKFMARIEENTRKARTSTAGKTEPHLTTPTISRTRRARKERKVPTKERENKEELEKEKDGGNTEKKKEMEKILRHRQAARRRRIGKLRTWKLML